MACLIYNATISVSPNQTIAYNYFINSGWDNPELPEGTNREIAVLEQDTIKNDKWIYPDNILFRQH